MKNTDEILDKLAHHITNISYRTYYRKRRAAIEALSTILWGFTAKETWIRSTSSSRVIHIAYLLGFS